MKYYLSICRQTVAQNRKLPKAKRMPPIRVSRGKHGKPKRYWGMLIDEPVTVVYDPDNPMPWGARAWMEWDA